MKPLLAGVSNSTIDKNQIRILGSNIRPELLTDIIPKIDTNIDINSYALDFYNHGGLKSKATFSITKYKLSTQQWHTGLKRFMFGNILLQPFNTNARTKKLPDMNFVIKGLNCQLGSLESTIRACLFHSGLHSGTIFCRNSIHYVCFVIERKVMSFFLQRTDQKIL